MGQNKNREWSEEDDRRLLDIRAAGKSSISIAAKLKRRLVRSMVGWAF
jgi:hypothetical protein